MAETPRRIPLWLKIAYTVWLAVWVPVYWKAHGPGNFFWICDFANFVVGVALWLESRLLFSAQALGVLIIQFLWMIDVGGRLLLGRHPIGGTEYMFDAATPLALRAMSLFHVIIPVLLLWAVARLGYDRSAWKLQIGLLWLLLPAGYLLTAPEENVNWLHRPFGLEAPEALAPWLLPLAMLVVPLVLYLPTHAVLDRWRGRSNAPVTESA